MLCVTKPLPSVAASYPRAAVRVGLRSRNHGICRASEENLSPQDMVWDPRGLLGDAKPAAGLIERKLAARKAQQAQSGANVPGPPIRPVAAQALNNGGWDLNSDDQVVNKAAFAAEMAASFMPVNLDFPGLRVLSIDPPVFVVDNFLDAETCADFISKATDLKVMQPSEIGSGRLGDAENASSHRRTSSSLLIDSSCTEWYPGFRDITSKVQNRVRGLLPKGLWGKPGKAPVHNHFCFEALQTARYDSGQHFLAHEDGFPVEMLKETTFQRRATVLVYLNDVGKGGKTTFQYLENVGVQPAQGRALVFFPAFKDGTPDGRTLHSGEDADDVKWIAQQWVACGMPSAAKSQVPIGFGNKSVASLMTQSLGKTSQRDPRLGGGLESFVKDFQPVTQAEHDIDIKGHLARRRKKQKDSAPVATPKPKSKGFGKK